MTHDQEALFHQVRLFSGLNHQELHSLEKGKEAWFNRGDKILDEGQHDTFYVVLEGKVDYWEDGVKYTYRKGDRFSIPKGKKHSAKVYAGYTSIVFFNQKERYKKKK